MWLWRSKFLARIQVWRSGQGQELGQGQKADQGQEVEVPTQEDCGKDPPLVEMQYAFQYVHL